MGRALLPRKLGRGLGNVSPTPGWRRRSRPGLLSRELLPGSSTSVGRSAGPWVSAGAVSLVASEGVWARTDRAMVGADPGGGSKAPWAGAGGHSWGSWSGGRGKKRPGVPPWPPPQACGVLVQCELLRRPWDPGVRGGLGQQHLEWRGPRLLGCPGLVTAEACGGAGGGSPGQGIQKAETDFGGLGVVTALCPQTVAAGPALRWNFLLV